MLSGNAVQVDRAPSGSAFRAHRDPRGSPVDRREPRPRWLREHFGTLSDGIVEADAYPSAQGFVALLAAAVFGMLVLATLVLLVQASGG